MSIQDAIKTLQSAFGDQVSTNASVLDAHGQSETYFPVTPPDAVVFPKSTAEVSEIVKICAANDCPIIAYGTGSSLEGHQLAVHGGISLNMSNMNAVIAVHAEDMDVVVQPGVTRVQLNEDLRATGLFFPVDPGANASIGGMTATRASGTTAVRYGTMRENVMALEVVMADGRIIRTGTRARKSSAGYDLTRLFIGSEGTLGIITEITLRLQGQPEAVSAATCSFPDIESAVNTVITTIQMGIPIARIEFVDHMMARGFNLHFKSGLPELPHLFVEFHGSEASVKEQAETFGEIVSDLGGSDFNWSSNPEDRSALWKMRHNAYYGMRSLAASEWRTLTTDICVPVSNLAEAVKLARVESDRLGLIMSIVGHVGDGNFHATINFDPADAAQTARVHEFTHNLNHLALSLDGTITGEHGIGLGKMKYMADEHGDALQIMVDIKKTLDPQNIMNPGKMLPSN